MGLAAEVGELGVTKLAVSHADADWSLNQSGALQWIQGPIPRQQRATPACGIHVAAIPEVRLPGGRGIVHVAGARATARVAGLGVIYVQGFAGTVNDEVHPWVEDNQSPLPVRNPGERHVSIFIALLEGERRTVRIAQRGVARGVV